MTPFSNCASRSFCFKFFRFLFVAVQIKNFGMNVVAEQLTPFSNSACIVLTQSKVCFSIFDFKYTMR